jgi:DNA-binding beta-propeller fold protein YncE
MDETSLRGLLETALGDEPPIGPVARNSLRAGIRLRRRARIRRAAGGTAVVVAMAAVIPAVTGVLGNTAAGPHRGAARKVPLRAEAAPKGTAYVINSGGGTVTPVNLATNTPGKPITVSGEPVAMAIALDGKTAYMINGFPSRTVTPIDLATNTPGKPITLSGEPVAMAIAPDGKTYVAISRGTVTSGGGFRSVYDFMPIDLATNRLGKPVKLSGEPGAIAIAPDGKTAYVAIYSSGTVTPIDLMTNTAGKPIKISGKPKAMEFYGQPMAIAITPDGKTAYVANGASSTVTPINLATNTPGNPINLSGKPGADAIAITPDGTTAYVANQASSTVTPVNLATNTPGKPIKIGSGWDSGFEAIVIAP